MRCLLFVLLLVVATRVSAETLQFPDQNFRMEIPTGWEAIKSPGALVTLRSLQGDQTIQISTAQLPQQERYSGASIARAKMRARYEKAGGTIDSEESATVRLVPYLVLKGHSAEPRYFQAYITSANGMLYTIQHTAKTAQPDGGQGLKSVLESFQLIRFWAFTADPAPTPSPTPDTGWKPSPLLATAGPPLLFMLILMGSGFSLYFLLR